MNKFKVGDKVRLKSNQSDYSTDFKKNDVGTVIGHDGVHLVYLKNNNGVNISIFDSRLELVETVHTPEELIKKANEGYQARNKLIEMGVKLEGRYKINGWKKYELSNNSTEELRVVQFEPFNTSNGWKVELKGDTIHIGCKFFNKNTLMNAFDNLIIKNYSSSHNSDFIATKNGINYMDSNNKYTLSWSDAELIYTKLK